MMTSLNQCQVNRQEQIELLLPLLLNIHTFYGLHTEQWGECIGELHGGKHRIVNFHKIFLNKNQSSESQNLFNLWLRVEFPSSGLKLFPHLNALAFVRRVANFSRKLKKGKKFWFPYRLRWTFELCHVTRNCVVLNCELTVFFSVVDPTIRGSRLLFWSHDCFTLSNSAASLLTFGDSHSNTNNNFTVTYLKREKKVEKLKFSWFFVTIKL